MKDIVELINECIKNISCGIFVTNFFYKLNFNRIIKELSRRNLKNKRY